MPRRRKPFAYTIECTRGDTTWQVEDPYRFPPLLGELDVYLMAEGTHRRIYEKLGAHPRTIDGVDGVAFAVWAPNAQRVSVVGDFNHGTAGAIRCASASKPAIWEIFIPGVYAGAPYKYEILGADGRLQPLKADPVGFAQEKPPATASRIVGLPQPAWTDEAWLEAARDAAGPRCADLDLRGASRLAGAARRATSISTTTSSPTSSSPTSPTWASPISSCCRSPSIRFDGSWGYQPIGLFAPTSRFGPPEAFARFVDRCHEAGIGVIIDWVPAHFPTDAHGLARFDGTALYEHEDPRLGFHRDWNTLIYNFGRSEVAQFPASPTRSTGSTASISTRCGSMPSPRCSTSTTAASRASGSRTSTAAARTSTRSPSCASSTPAPSATYPGATTIAEESTAWPQVSRPVDGGGLGFGYKWNMGWMHDTLEYMQHEPVHRNTITTR